MSKRKRIKTWFSENKIFIVALLSFIVAFSGLTLQTIIFYIRPFFFPGPPDYEITTFNMPQTLDLNLPLIVSPKYYVVIHLHFESQQISTDGSLKFSISFENKGKTDVQQPRLTLYFVDSLQQVRATWNHSLTTNEFVKGLVLEYKLPPPDQKVMGTWNLIILLHDDGTQELISYVVQEFTVTEEWIILDPLVISFSLIAAIAAITAAMMVMRRMLIERKK